MYTCTLSDETLMRILRKPVIFGFKSLMIRVSNLRIFEFFRVSNFGCWNLTNLDFSLPLMPLLIFFFFFFCPSQLSKSFCSHHRFTPLISILYYLPPILSSKVFRVFSTTSVHRFRGRPRGYFPSVSKSVLFRSLPLIVLLYDVSLHCPSHCILWLVISPLIVAVFDSYFNNYWLNSLRHWPVSVILTGPHVFLQILFSNIFGLRCVTFVIIHTLQP